MVAHVGSDRGAVSCMLVEGASRVAASCMVHALCTRVLQSSSRRTQSRRVPLRLLAQISLLLLSVRTVGRGQEHQPRERRAFPRGDRAPDIVPAGEADLRRALAAESALAGVGIDRTHRVNSGFYLSQAFELGPAS